jgi:hypothetical protein
MSDTQSDIEKMSDVKEEIKKLLDIYNNLAKKVDFNTRLGLVAARIYDYEERDEKLTHDELVAKMGYYENVSISPIYTPECKTWFPSSFC